jgi:hypothetical protein
VSVANYALILLGSDLGQNIKVGKVNYLSRLEDE